jgi:hypothetical protein
MTKTTDEAQEPYEGLSAEGYAALWGCDPVYDKPPRLPGDGYLFYNYGSERQKRTPAWLGKFASAICRTIKRVKLEQSESQERDLVNLDNLLTEVMLERYPKLRPAPAAQEAPECALKCFVRGKRKLTNTLSKAEARALAIEARGLIRYREETYGLHHKGQPRKARA